MKPSITFAREAAFFVAALFALGFVVAPRFRGESPTLRSLPMEVQIAGLDVACRSVETFREWAAAVAEGNYSKVLPEPPECLQIPVRARVTLTARVEYINLFGEPTPFRQFTFEGITRWSKDDDLDVISPKPEISKEARAVIADMKLMYDALQRVRFRSAFHRCKFGACSPIDPAFLKAFERAWSDTAMPATRELIGKGVTVTPPDIWGMASDYADTKGMGNDVTEQHELELRILFEEY